MRLLPHILKCPGLLVGLTLLGASDAVYAEGSKEINNNTGHRAFLEYRSDFTSNSTVPRKTIIYAYAKNGETISLGSSASGIGSGTLGAGLGGIVWYAPDGTVGTNTSATIGRITNRTQEFAGPLPNVGGYTPNNLTVNASTEGIWRIDFVSPNMGVDVAPPAVTPANTTDWASPQPAAVQYVTAWDVTVRSGGVAQNGRVYATQIAMNMGGNSRFLRSVVNFLTSDGYQYQCNLNGIDPFGFNFFADNNGFENGSVGGGPLFKSVPAAGSHIQSPNDPDTATEITHKLFFNTPDATMPSSASSYSGTDWLNPVTVSPPNVSSTVFVGLDGTTNQLGSASGGSLGGTFTFTGSGPGIYIIAIDLNGNGVSTDAVDRVLLGTSSSGVNNVFWDGKDGQGNPATRSGGSSFSSKVTLANGVVHFPFLDVETASSGFIIQRQNGPATGRSTIYWDDTGLGGGYTKSLPPTGTDSTGGAHAWGTNLGNNMGMDTWALVMGNTTSNSLVIKTADLEVVSKTNSPAVVWLNTNITYTVVIRNNGPDNVDAGRLLEQFPRGLTNITFVSSTFSASGAIVSSSLSTNVYDARVSMANGETGTFTFRGTVNGAVGSSLTNVAKFLSYNDVGDPNDPTRIGAGNNGKTNIVVVSGSSDIGIWKTPSVSPVLATNQFSYTITVTNFGPSAATSLVVTDSLPAGVTFISATGGGTTNGSNQVSWSIPGPLAVNGGTNLTLTVKAPASGAITNVATAWSALPEPDLTNNNVTNIVAVTASADLKLGKTSSASPVTATNQFTYTIAVTNFGPSVATSLVVTDSLPSTLTFISATGGGTTNGSNQVIWSSLGDLSVNGVTNLSITVKAPAEGSITNVAIVASAVSDPVADNAATNIVAVTASADLKLGKTSSASPVTATNQFTYTIAVTNFGPSMATSLVVTDSLPSNLTFISATGGGTTNASNQVIWGSLGSLASGAVTNLSITVKAPAAGSVTNIATAASAVGDPVPDNAATNIVAVTEQADVGLGKTPSVSPVSATNQFTYTIAVTNFGPSVATSLVVTDSLPSNLTFISATGGGTTNASNQVIWGSLGSLAASGVTNLSITVKAPDSGVITNTASVASALSDPTPGNNHTPDVITTVIASSTIAVSGTVYVDANHNMRFDAGESGSGLTLYAKLFSTNTPGSASSAVVVDPSTGTYSFNTSSGIYNIIIDDNNNLSDVMPAVISGWIGMEAPGLVRSNIVVGAVSVPSQNFGLYHGDRLTGQVFEDNGNGGGTPNDGIQNGTEPGLNAVTVKLFSGSTVLDTTTTTNGSYTVYIPYFANGSSLKVVENNLNNYISTAGTAGNTGGAYDRPTDAITFTYAAGTTYSGVNFADAQVCQFFPDHQLAALPGTVVFYAHTFIAGSGGQVTFTTTNAPTPALTGWSEVLYLDANGNGQLDSGETQITGPITVTAGQKVSILVKEFVPVTAPLNAQNLISVTAGFSYVNAVPALVSNIIHTDLTTVGNGTTAGLMLLKQVDKAAALPGETLMYTLTYINQSSEVLSNIRIFDTTPAYTLFQSASYGALPSNLTACAISAPASNTTGAVRWFFTGALSGGATGTVSYAVQVQQ